MSNQRFGRKAWPALGFSEDAGGDINMDPNQRPLRRQASNSMAEFHFMADEYVDIFIPWKVDARTQHAVSSEPCGYA
jgi:hypothetical protein